MSRAKHPRILLIMYLVKEVHFNPPALGLRRQFVLVPRYYECR
jgi:hypothetical protein